MTKFCVHPNTFDCIHCVLGSRGVKEEDILGLASAWYLKNMKPYAGGCHHCGGLDEPYMLNNKLWKQVNGRSKGILCLSCAQMKLGRTIVLADFTADAPINFGCMGFDCRTYVIPHKKAA